MSSSISIPPPPLVGHHRLESINGQVSWVPTATSTTTTTTTTNALTPPPPPTKHALLILAGQSNCQSVNDGPVLPMDINTDPNIYAWNRYTKSWVYAQHPLPHLNTFGSNSVGFGLEAARVYRQVHPDTAVYLVCCALGGTAFTPSKDTGMGSFSWRPTYSGPPANCLYSLMIQSTREALNSLSSFPGVYIAGLLWHQGESDLGNANYSNDLYSFINYMRTDLLVDNKGDGNIPFIGGTMMKSWRNINEQLTYPIHKVHLSLNQVWLSSCCDFDDLTGKYDYVHFDANSQREMGRRYGMKLLEVEKIKTDALIAFQRQQQQQSNTVHP